MGFEYIRLVYFTATADKTQMKNKHLKTIRISFLLVPFFWVSVADTEVLHYLKTEIWII